MNCVWFSGPEKVAERKHIGNLIRKTFLEARKGGEGNMT
jgi:hypothetical protein